MVRGEGLNHMTPISSQPEWVRQHRQSREGLAVFCAVAARPLDTSSACVYGWHMPRALPAMLQLLLGFLGYLLVCGILALLKWLAG